MNYYQIVDKNTNESVYLRADEPPVIDKDTWLFESFDEGKTYIEITP